MSLRPREETRIAGPREPLGPPAAPHDAEHGRCFARGRLLLSSLSPHLRNCPAADDPELSAKAPTHDRQENGTS
jgi:hypothetical protein